MTKKMKMIESLMHDLTESVERYEQAKLEEGLNIVMVGYGVEQFDSRESIKRRITVVREELLKVSKMIDGLI